MITGIPEAVRLFVMSNWPATKNARYVAIGSVSRQCQVRCPPDRFEETRAPLPRASTSAGTLTFTSKRALSRGWSLLGNHQAAISGSPTAAAPSPVVIHG